MISLFEISLTSHAYYIISSEELKILRPISLKIRQARMSIRPHEQLTNLEFPSSIANLEAGSIVFKRYVQQKARFNNVVYIAD